MARVNTYLNFMGKTEEATVTSPPAVMFWGGYFTSLTDRFGVQWMFNCTAA